MQNGEAAPTKKMTLGMELPLERNSRDMSSGQPLLAVEGVTVRFGGVVALDGVSFSVERGQICGVIGPNGAGKTSLFNCISRLYAPRSGSIRFDGVHLETVARHAIAKLGIARTFQNLALFATMSVRENIMVGVHSLARGGFWVNGMALPFARAGGKTHRRAGRRAH